MNIRQAHAFCAALPGASLDHKWRFGDSVHPVFSVGGRMFAMFSMQSDELLDRLMFKADDARFLELTDRDGIEPAPYLARAKWVRLDRPTRLSGAELKSLLADAHAAIVAKLSKKKRAEILGTPPVADAGAATGEPAMPTRRRVAAKTAAGGKSATSAKRSRPRA